MFEEKAIKLEYIIPITTIAQELENYNIPYVCVQLWDGLQLRFPWCDGDIICHSGSFGHEYGNVESYCFYWDNNDCTELEPKKAIDLLIHLYAEMKFDEILKSYYDSIEG